MKTSVLSLVAAMGLSVCLNAQVPSSINLSGFADGNYSLGRSSVSSPAPGSTYPYEFGVPYTSYHFYAGPPAGKYYGTAVQEYYIIIDEFPNGDRFINQIVKYEVKPNPSDSTSPQQTTYLNMDGNIRSQYNRDSEGNVTWSHDPVPVNYSVSWDGGGFGPGYVAPSGGSGPGSESAPSSSVPDSFLTGLDFQNGTFVPAQQ